VAWARIDTKTWFQKNAKFLFPLLAFIMPLLVRSIPEILMGEFLVGFDTMAYYVPNTLTWLRYGVTFQELISSAPLIYVLLMGITSSGASLVLSLKILGPLLLGLLGLVVFFYANKALSWSPKKSLLVALISTLFFVALRTSWDMLRSELALVFLFSALLILLKSRLNLKTGLLLSLFMTLVVLTHQLVAVIMFVIVLTVMLILTLKKKTVELTRIGGCLVPAALLFGIVIYINYFVFYSSNFFGGLEDIAYASHAEIIANTLGFFAFCYLPLIPLIVFGVKRFKGKLQLNIWIAWIFALVVVSMLSPATFHLGGVLPYRWILLLAIPFAFYAVEGLSVIKWNWYKISVGSFLVLLSMGFLFLPNSEAFFYYDNFPSYVPKSMLQNTVQLSDCNDTANALLWVNNNIPADGVLLVHEAFYGWASLTIDSDRLVHYFFSTPEEAINKLSMECLVVSPYLIWWVNGSGWYGQPTVSSLFQEVYQSGNIAVYRYSASSTSVR
jgi:hypothetical protein